jgi:hypothetical protein
MGRLALLGITTFTLLSTCAAEFRPCRFADASTTGSSEGITIRQVGLIEPTGEVEGLLAAVAIRRRWNERKTLR